MREGYVVAVDSGGTFSDCVVVDALGRTTTGKAASTPADFSEGVLAAVASAAERLDLTAAELLREARLFAHGTTVATNALLTRTGSVTGLLATRGHEDAITIGRTFQKVAGLTEAEMTQVSRLAKPAPVVPRRLIAGVDERVDRAGRVVVALNEASLEEAVDALVERGAESIAVCFLWSFLNPVHEQLAGRYLAERLPDVPVSLSSVLAPVIKEYERSITTAINGYLVGRTGRYLAALIDRLRRDGYAGSPLVMQSSGGVTSMSSAQRRAVNLLTSGPAGGVKAAKAMADVLGHRDVITTDVGGTSFDVGVIVDGEPLYAESPVFDGFQLVTPMIDVATIGAGGGSIAWIEPASGILQVGPQSAGASPGPACYGRGGTRPTVTDADVVLGRVNPEYFLGGRATLDAPASRRALEEHVAGPLGVSLEEAALAIVRIADAHMSDLVRRVSVERGHDPRRFGVYAFGGAGPLHVGAYAASLRARFALIPSAASEFSAFGIAASDLLAVAELSEPMVAPFDPGRLAEVFDELERRVADELHDNGVAPDNMSFSRFARLRYRGQVHEVRTPVPPLNGSDQPLVDAFERLYESKYGRGAAYKKAGMQAMTFIVHGHGSLNHAALAASAIGAPEVPVDAATERDVVFAADGAVRTPIFRMHDLRPGHRAHGPCVIEAPTTTILVHPAQRIEVDAYRNVVLTFPQPEDR